MAKRGKKFLEMKKKIEAEKKYPLDEAIGLVKEVSYSSFVGSVELHVKTSANPKYNDQMIRGTVVLPHGTGKSVRVAAFVSPEKEAEAKKAGADIVGSEILLADIAAGKIDFDVLVTSGDMMRSLAKVAKVLWPKGLMPSPKAWTVSTDIPKTIDELKKWRVELKLDKTGNIHALVGKVNFDDEKIAENVQSVLTYLINHKPVGVKGKLLKKVVLAPTMWPGVPVMWNE